MSMETQGATAPTLDVLSEVEALFADVDLRAVYLDALAGGEVSDDIAQAIGKLSDSDFVKLLYTEILRRDAEPGAVEFWAAELTKGTSRDDLIDTFAVSAESLSISGPDEVALLGQHFASAAAHTDM